ncbi:MAG: DUF1800 domain-containing protein [Caldilineaceae bacterium]
MVRHETNVLELIPETPADAGDTGSCAEYGKTMRGLNRRTLLRGLGATAAVSSIAALAQTPPVDAQAGATASPRPSMRRWRSIVSAAAAGEPALPEVEVIAYNRMAYGPRPGDLAAFRALGGTPEARLQAFVDQQLDPASIVDTDCDNRLAAQGYATLDKTLQQTWWTYVRREDNPNLQVDRYLPAKEVESATLIRAIYSKRQLQEVMTEYWHDHFNIYGWDFWTAPTYNHFDRDVIRAHIFGNFRQMLEAVAKSPAMLYYLDNQSNQGGDPNENYARELFELHGMGAENYYGVRKTDDPAIFDGSGNRLGYVDDDVYGATTCFTGWRANGDTGLFEYDDSRHFPYQKVVLDKVLPPFQGIKDGYDVLDLIANHPNTGTYIARRMCKRLISDNPPESVVQSAAAVFRANVNAPDQLKQVTRAILLSPEFRNTWGQKIKRPFEYAISLFRAAQADFDPINNFFWWYEPMGQPLFAWSPPDGYPDYRTAWTSTMTTLQRWRFVNSVLGWKFGGDGPNKDMLRIRLPEQTPSSVNTPIQLVDYWSNRILGRVMPNEEYTPIVEFIAQGRGLTQPLPANDITDRLPHMVALIFMAPSFMWR